MLLDDYGYQTGKRLSILDKDGKVDTELMPDIDDETLVEAYKAMLLTRTADDKAVKLQRQGRLGAYPPVVGQEASQIGPAMALGDEDWLVWAFREMGALLWKGVPLWRQYLYWMGNEEGNNVPSELNVTPTAVPVASQLPHAVGISHSFRLKEEGRVVMAFFGDGATSEGDFHEAMNLAGVLSTPTVFLCQNNQYAISLKRKRQTAASTIAQKAHAYGFPGIQVDGNDLFALYAAAREAVERAREGEGPTLIESYTYRIGDHTTSDDATRYRSQEEIEKWKERDPIDRLRKYLAEKGLWDDAKEEEAQERAREQVEEAVKEAESFPEPSVDDIFEYVYSSVPKSLKEQADRLKEE